MRFKEQSRQHSSTVPLRTKTSSLRNQTVVGGKYFMQE